MGGTSTGALDYGRDLFGGSETESDLMARIVAGEVRDFEKLYDRLSGSAFSLAMRILNDRGRAADVTQEAFLELWSHRERYRPDRGTPSAWLMTIVRNRVIDAYRSALQRGGPPREERWIPEQAASGNTEDRTIARDEACNLRKALELLPTDQLTVINLAYFGGFTQSEIAQRLGLPIGTVKGRVRLALCTLKLSVPQLA
jgi:RNA polymerase sigma-70 factor, ECF subfamily